MKKFQFILLSILSGILLSLGWYGFGVFLLVSLIPLLFVEDYFWKKRNQNKSIAIFWYAYTSFFTWNLITTWWVYNSTAFGGIAAITLNSLFYTVIFWIFHIIKRKLGAKIGYFSLIIIWLAWEYTYINGEISWVWLVLGNGFANNVKIIQWYEYTGALGGSFWILLTNVLITIIILHIKKYKTLYGQIFNTLILLSVIIFPIIFSIHRYKNYKEEKNPVNIVITQPNIDPYNMKFSGMSAYDQLSRIFNLADSLVDKKTDYVVAPETAIEDHIWENSITSSESVRRIIDYCEKHKNIDFVTGATTRYMYENKKPSATARTYRNTGIKYDVFNTALQFSYNQEIKIYHKSKLVIGVEMLPYPEYLGFLSDLAIDLGGSAGSLGTQQKREVFTDKQKNTSIAPVICYESIYGEYVTDYIKKGANLIFVITNDGWWGDTPGYKQHLSFSRLRAIENRRSVARSANTGISCFINQKGDVLQATEYWVKDAIKGKINSNNKLTFYTKNGDFIGRISSFLALLILLMLLVKLIKKDLLDKV